MSNLFNLKSKRVLVTGASGHLGYSITKTLLEAGASLILILRKDSKNINDLQNDFPSQVKIYHADIGNSEHLTNTCQYIKKEFSKIDGIVNNAYSGVIGDLEEINEIDFQIAMQLNIHAPFQIVKELLPCLERSSDIDVKEYSSVVNICSMYGKVSPQPKVYDFKMPPNPIHYGSTKAGLIQQTKYLACFLADRGIRVNSLSPGAFPNLEKVENDKFISNLVSRIPLARIGSPDEIGGPVAFLLSSASSYITGVDLSVDGGWTAW